MFVVSRIVIMFLILTFANSLFWSDAAYAKKRWKKGVAAGIAILGGALILNELSKKNRRYKPRQGRSRHKQRRKHVRKHTVARRNKRRQHNRRVQKALSAQGYNVGTADGVMGRQSRRAISQYQTSLGDRATGRLNKEQSRMLLNQSAGVVTAAGAMGLASIQTASNRGRELPETFEIMKQVPVRTLKDCALVTARDGFFANLVGQKYGRYQCVDLVDIVINKNKVYYRTLGQFFKGRRTYPYRYYDRSYGKSWDYEFRENNCKLVFPEQLTITNNNDDYTFFKVADMICGSRRKREISIMVPKTSRAVYDSIIRNLTGISLSTFRSSANGVMPW